MRRRRGAQAGASSRCEIYVLANTQEASQTHIGGGEGGPCVTHEHHFSKTVLQAHTHAVKGHKNIDKCTAVPDTNWQTKKA